MRTVSFDRDQALSDAMDVFWEKGFTDASIEDLTSATGLHRSSLYNTFVGKRELFLAALARYHERCSSQHWALAHDENPVRAIRDLVQTILSDELDDSRGMGCLVANAALEFSGRDPEVRALTSANLTEMSEAIASAVTRGQSLSLLSEAIDATAVARSIVTTIQGLRVIAKALSGEDRIDWLSDATESCLRCLQR
ncbi:TetR/AcrR family transcriptional regulator [Rhodococcus sp. H29-C3]|uniref:TetR/AcrR family transcriptional regulator n=1 Tax=Rhodococcus sp. H29-C3 TaxID=3046307 RepID=UPI0024BAF32A|nr:TetR/AcrR family transcriptional regulator [Rhodococcus sp. H29-C3]MDJ0363195.1 TetR/AcrR family transcriptional regulator [Rhodococcus sp. H29-C3]